MKDMRLRSLWRVVPASLLLLGCSQTQRVRNVPAADGTGTLLITANGEDFVRQGFVTKDGWQVNFDNVYVTLADISAYQTDPPFDPDKQAQPNAIYEVDVSAPITVDLAAGDETAAPIVVEKVSSAPAGRYNALAWEVVPAETGPSEGYSITMIGTATKEGSAVPFQIQLDDTLGFVCGDFIGDDRKGILGKDETAEVEATFHFDHLFGDNEQPASEDINVGALGFDPIAALASDGRVVVSSDDLEQNLDKADFEALQMLLPSLGHVGEGHCKETSS